MSNSDSPLIFPAMLATLIVFYFNIVSPSAGVVTTPILSISDALRAVSTAIMNGMVQILPLTGLVLGAAVLLSTASAGAKKFSEIPNPYETSAFGERKRVEETETTVDECINCELNDVDGVEHVARREQVVAGRVVRTLETTSVDECLACRDADTVEYGLRAARDDPARPGDQDDSDDVEDLTRIKYVGDAVAANLREAGFETVADVRDAEPAELEDIQGLGEQRVEDIQVGSNPVALELGFGVARRLADAGFETVDDIRQADVDDLTDARRVGQVTAEQVLDVVDTADHDGDQVDAVRLECPGCGAYIESTRPFQTSDCPGCGEWELEFDGDEPEVEAATE